MRCWGSHSLRRLVCPLALLAAQRAIHSVCAPFQDVWVPLEYKDCWWPVAECSPVPQSSCVRILPPCQRVWWRQGQQQSGQQVYC
eukprot:1842168-Amphidinium_carterae.1